MIVRKEDSILESDYSDSTVFRFLASVDFNMKEALTAIRTSADWRKKFEWNEIENINPELVQTLLSYTKVGYYGHDFEGRPIKIVQPMKVDIDNILKNIPEGKTFHYQVGNAERMINIIFPLTSQHFDKHIYHQVVIVDLKNIEFGQFVKNPKLLDMARSRSKIFQENYPETTHKTVLINASGVFYVFWKIVSVFMKKKTLDRITILKDSYIGELLKITTIDKLPECIGGTCQYEIDKYPNLFDADYQKSVDAKKLRLI